jgi:two-component system, sporulation sensor kinase E
MIKDNEEAMLVEVGRMAARLIHDLKNQLGGLKLYAAYLQKRFADDAEGVEIAGKIAQGLNEMAEQAAILSKLSRPLELRMEGGDPAPVIEQIVNSLRPRASAKRVMIASNLEPARISFDSRQLGAALEAVLSRAVDAAPEGGEVVVALTRRDEELRIEIKDNGAALDDDKRLKFFDPLAGDRINRTALGLAMARRIIERHGGRITARANTAAGTIVEVNLSMG